MAAAIPYRRTFVRLLGFLRPYKWSLAVSVVLAVASQGAQIALVHVTGDVIDDAIKPRDYDALRFFIFLILGMPAGPSARATMTARAPAARAETTSATNVSAALRPKSSNGAASPPSACSASSRPTTPCISRRPAAS